MAAEEEQGNQSNSGSTTVKNTFTETVFTDDLAFILLHPSFSQKVSFDSIYLLKSCSSYSLSVFHPPLV